MTNKELKLDIDQLAKLILGLYDEGDRKNIISLLEKNDSITPEIEEAIEMAFGKQADAMEEELAELKAIREEFAGYREELEGESGELEKDLDESSVMLQTDLSDLDDGVDKIEEEFKVDENQNQIEALRNKLLGGQG